MRGLAGLNIAAGFFVVGLISCFGAILSFDIADAVARSPTTLLQWQVVLQKSAHGHGNLFGMLHILFGSTLRYSLLPRKWKCWQSLGLFLGTLAAGPLMWFRSLSPQPGAPDLMTYIVSAFFAASLASIFSHSMAVFFASRKNI